MLPGETIAQATDAGAASAYLEDHNRTPSNINIVKNSLSSPSNFMTPTFASRRSETDRSRDGATKSVPVKSIKASASNSLFRSAARRVGLSVGDRVSRGRKEGQSKHDAAISISDKLSTTAHLNIVDSPLTAPEHLKDPSMLSLSEKPLPTLPPSHLNMGGPDGSSTSLVEPIDKPLTAFASAESSSEEWAVMEPTSSHSSGTLQKMMRQNGNDLKRQAVASETYSKMGEGSHPSRSGNQWPVPSRYSSTQHLPQQEASSFNVHKSSNANRTLDAVDSLIDPFGDHAEATDPCINAKTKASIENIKAAAAAVERPARVPKESTIPRQTKTSSLRARLSAAQLIEGEQSRPLGFTNSPAPQASSDPLTDPSRKGNGHSRKALHARHSDDNLQLSVWETASSPSMQKEKSAKSLRSKKMRDELANGNAPAHFRRGSQPPDLDPRPGSHTSNWDAPSSSFPGPSSRASNRHLNAPSQLPKKRAISNQSSYPIIETKIKPRKSSIPVPNHLKMNSASKATSTNPNTSKNAQASTMTRKGSHFQSSVLKGCSSTDLASELETEKTDSSVNLGSIQIFEDANESRSLAIIAESPHRPFTTKHISLNSPQYGPSLRISPSAERLIMGSPDTDTANKENLPINQKVAKSVLPNLTNGVYKQPSAFFLLAPNARKRADRPLSTHEISLSNSRHGLTHSSARERKVKSADLSSTSSVTFTSDHDTSRTNIDASKVSQASCGNDPNFDAQEKSGSPAIDGLLLSHEQDNKQGFVDESSWIARLRVKNGKVPLEVEGTQSREGRMVKDLKAQHEAALLIHPMKDCQLDSKFFNRPSGDVQPHMLKQQAHTPIHSVGKTFSSAGSHPPRSSSRIAHPHCTIASPSPSPSTVEKAPPTPSKDAVYQKHMQDSLASIPGHTSLQYDISNLNSKQTSVAYNPSARNSYQFSGRRSTSKKPFSSIRNVFNKRNTTPDSFKSLSNKLQLSKGVINSQTSISKPRKPFGANIRSPMSPVNVNPSFHHPHPASIDRSITPRNTPSSISAAASNEKSLSPSSGSTTTTLAMDLLAAARNEQSPIHKAKLLQMSKVMVDAITQARDAEKAAEEAKMAARKAEVAKEICDGLLGEVGRVIGEWRGSLEGAGGI